MSLHSIKKHLSLCFPNFCQRVDLSLKNSMPWLVLAGSGGLADFLSDVLENLSSAPAVQSSGEGDSEAGPSMDLKDKVAERVKKHFPTEAESDKLVERVGAVDRDMLCGFPHAEQEIAICSAAIGWITEKSNVDVHNPRGFQMFLVHFSHSCVL